MKKIKFCPYCNEPLEQGHRKDKCKKEKFPKTRFVSKDRLYVSPKYRDMRFEMIETPFGFSAVVSGAINNKQITKEESIEYKQKLIKITQDTIK